MFWLCTPTRSYSHTNTQEQKNHPLTLSPDWVKCCFGNQHQNQRPKKAANAVENYFFWFWDIRQSRQVKTGETNKVCKTKADAARLSAMWHIRSSEWTWLCVKEVGYPKKHVWSSFSFQLHLGVLHLTLGTPNPGEFNLNRRAWNAPLHLGPSIESRFCCEISNVVWVY